MRDKKKRKRKQKSSLLIKVFGIILIVIAMLIITGVIIFFLLSYNGKKELQKNAGKAPEIPSAMQDIANDNEDDANWQDGWVRYQDKIYEYNESIITFLIMGIDKQGKVKPAANYQSGGQSDALFLVACDTDKGNISVIPINRNTMTPIEVCDKDGNYIDTMTAQITLQHAYGDGMKVSCERTRDSVSKLFYDLPIHGYCSLNMGAITTLNDDLGGVEVTVLEDLTMMDERLVEGSDVLLQGDMAYYYLRKRHEDEFDSASKRLERQKQYISAFLKKLLQTVKHSPTKAIDIYQDVIPYVVTDLEMNEISYFSTLASSFDYSGYQMYSLDGKTVMGERFEEYEIDEQSLYDLIIKVFYKEVTLP